MDPSQFTPISKIETLLREIVNSLHKKDRNIQRKADETFNSKRLKQNIASILTNFQTSLKMDDGVYWCTGLLHCLQ